MNEKCPIFETVAKGDSNPGSLDCECGILPLSYCASRDAQNVVHVYKYYYYCVLWTFPEVNFDKKYGAWGILGVYRVPIKVANDVIYGSTKVT